MPGKLRPRHVKIGRHVPVSPGAVPRFLARFEAVYRAPELGRIDRVVAVPAAHHRLLWIHPFLDGNGRVARLVSHAMLRETGVGTSLWSVSRGLARSVTDYKRALMAADEPRRNDVDGRGALSEVALTEFCEFFLRVCVDQVEFMASVLEPAIAGGSPRSPDWVSARRAACSQSSSNAACSRRPVTAPLCACSFQGRSPSVGSRTYIPG